MAPFPRGGIRTRVNRMDTATPDQTGRPWDVVAPPRFERGSRDFFRTPMTLCRDGDSAGASKVLYDCPLHYGAVMCERQDSNLRCPATFGFEPNALTTRLRSQGVPVRGSAMVGTARGGLLEVPKNHNHKRAFRYIKYVMIQWCIVQGSNLRRSIQMVLSHPP